MSFETRNPNRCPVALRRSHRRPAGTYARRHGLVLALLFGVWLPQLKMVSRHRGPPLSTLGRRRRCQREPGYLRDDAVSLTAALGAHGLEQPRMLPAGNQSRELGDLTTNATHLTTLPPGGVPYPDPSTLGRRSAGVAPMDEALRVPTDFPLCACV